MIKDTEHQYRGFTIVGTTYLTSGRNVRAGNSWRYVHSTWKRNYNIRKDGKLVYHPGVRIHTLKDAKETVDRIIERNETKNVERTT